LQGPCIPPSSLQHKGDVLATEVIRNQWLSPLPKELAIVPSEIELSFVDAKRLGNFLADAFLALKL
jgi:hypothetical protein